MLKREKKIGLEKKSERKCYLEWLGFIYLLNKGGIIWYIY